MRRARWMAAVLVAACGGRTGEGGGQQAAAAASPVDSLCGQIWTVGAEPDLMVDLELESGVRVRLEGELSKALIPLAGVRVCAATEPSTKRIRTVRGFIVTSVGGEPALDGVLVARDSAYFLRTTADGREVPLARILGPMQQEIGKRLWVVVDDSGRVKVAGPIP